MSGSTEPRVDYVETGEGPAVVFVPGSFGTPAAWRGIQKRLPEGYRFVSTSLCGYGGTEETWTLDDVLVAHQVRVIKTVAERAGGPVHLVGHSFGGTICLVAALSGDLDIASIATFKANPLAMMKERDPALYDSTREMSRAFEAAYDAGEADASGRIIDFWGGVGSFAAFPEVVKNYCRATTFANVLDWRSAFDFNATVADYAGLEMPVLLVRGAQACPEMVAITETLGACLPNETPAVIEAASHFLITTHAEECASLLAGFLGGLDAQS
jgi:pimeloyl-ACP methyl ester carboxylesterase